MTAYVLCTCDACCVDAWTHPHCCIQRALRGVAYGPEGLHFERRQLWAVELAPGSLPFSVELRKWKGLFVNGFE